jgi:hypothetical protein
MITQHNNGLEGTPRSGVWHNGKKPASSACNPSKRSMNQADLDADRLALQISGRLSMFLESRLH